MSRDGAGPSPRERRRIARRRQILDLALEIAEAEGWEAVTTRRLADGIDFSQPIIYQHFSSREDVIRTVALEGFSSLASRVRELDREQTDPAGVAKVCRVYLDFAREHPRLYEAMFTESVGLSFADEVTPPPLTDAFSAILSHVARHVPLERAESAAELVWACCHGLASLRASGRIPPDRLDEHLHSIQTMISTESS